MKIFLMFVGAVIIIVVIPEILEFIFVRKKLENEILFLKIQLEAATNIIKHNNEVIEGMARNASQYSQLAYMKQDISKDEIEAVKYAMKKSHPDNGGNAEDFIRFQKVYEELAKK